MPTLLRVIWIAAGLAMLLGRVRDGVLSFMPPARALAQVQAADNLPWIKGGFRLGGAYSATEAGQLPAHIPNAGSWLDGDAWEGRAETEWFRPRGAKVQVAVAGYPQLKGCKLQAEFRSANGMISRVDCPIPNPREQWSLWKIRYPQETVALRLVSEDRTGELGGWVAFSHPFTAWTSELSAAYQLLQIFTTTALALTLIWGPGMTWLGRFKTLEGGARCPQRADLETITAKPDGDIGLHLQTISPAHEWRTVILIGSGPLLLAAIGVAIWCTSGLIQPQTFGRVAVTAVWSVIGLWWWRRGFRLELGQTFQRALAISAIVVVAVVAKSFYSVGPQGELFRGTVSRNFQMGDRIDSRYSFYIVQAATHHLRPASPEAEKFFFPWTFFSRGPLAGLAATPLVLATDGRPPTGMPEDRWSPYDRTGFAAYRITMIALASSVVVALFLMLVPLLGETWSLTAAGLLALSPFGVHEMMFTWPKWVATAWLIASFGLAHARRPLGAGLVLGVGFMFHPLVLLWAPWLALWSAVRSERSVKSVALAWVKIGAATGIIVVPWMTIGALMPHLSTTPLPGQVGFLHYWARADWKIATWDTWWSTRWMNFANTFLPLHLYFDPTSFNHPKLNSAYETSGRLIRFSLVWWNSLPFGLGLGLWVVGLVAMMRACRSRLAPLLVFAVGPALLITAYWGIEPLGLMRECGHPLFVAVIAITCVIAAQANGWMRALLQHRAVPWLQIPETWLMLWLTTLLNPAPWAVEFHQLDPLYFTINALALVAAAWVLSRKRVSTPTSAVSSSLAQAVRV